MAISATVVLDQPALVRALEKRSANAVAKRADQLGTQMAKIITDMIDSDLGPSSGRNRPGLISMRDIEWQFRVENPGELPIKVTLFSDDLGGGMMAKFGALNWGHKKFRQVGEFSLLSGKKARREETHPVEEIDQPAQPGHEWLQRVAGIARGRAGARFI